MRQTPSPLKSFASAENHAKERKLFLSCLECIALGPLFSAFVVLQWTHLSLSTSYRIERVLKFEFLAKKFGPYAHTVDEVHDSGMFWEWLTSTLNQTLAVQMDELGNSIPQKEWGQFVRFNKVVGGIRLIQHRGSQAPCVGRPGVVCYGLDDSTEPFGYPPCTHPSTGTTREPVYCYHPERYLGAVNTQDDEGFALDQHTGLFEMWLDTREPRQTLQRRIEYLEDRHWIDKQTRMVSLEVMLRNDNFEPLLSEVLITFEFDRTGYIHEEALVETIPASPYNRDRPLKLVLGAAFVLWNLILVTSCVYRLVRLISERGCAPCQPPLESGLAVAHHAAELFSLAVAAVQITLWSAYVPMVGGVLSELDVLERPSQQPFHNSTDEGLWLDYHHNVSALEERTRSAIQVMRWIRELSGLTIVCVLVRHVRVWEGIPAFAAVSRTLSLSAVRLGGVLLSALTLVSIFAGAAMLNFGSHLESFHNIQQSVQETAVIAMTGEPGIYSQMDSVDPVFTALWFWALIALMFVVVMNMILGILVDAAQSAAEKRKDGVASEPQLSLNQQFDLMLRFLGSSLCAKREKPVVSRLSDASTAATPEHPGSWSGPSSAWRQSLSAERDDVTDLTDLEEALEPSDFEATLTPWRTSPVKGSAGAGLS